MPHHRHTELTFQAHIAAFLDHEHHYRVLAQDEISDPDNAIAEEELWTFLDRTQSEALRKLAEDYGRDACAELFRALRRELAVKELWRIIRDGLTVAGEVPASTIRDPVRQKAAPQHGSTIVSRFGRISTLGRTTKRSTLFSS